MRFKTILLNTAVRFCLLAFVLALSTQGNSSARAEGKKYAFLVGVGGYDEKELRPLPYARLDILEFRKVLLESGFQNEHIVLMVDDLKALPESNPVGRFLPETDKIKDELGVLIPALEPEDTLIIALAGHGVQYKDDAEPYFCPSNVKLKDKNTLISLAWIYKQLEFNPQTKVGCKARQRLLIVDACRNDPRSRLARARDEVTLESVTKPQLTPLPEGVVALFSCAEGQEALEHGPLKHGIFFHHVLEAWGGRGDSDANQQLTLDEMIAFTKSKTQDYARINLRAAQTPRQKGYFDGTWVLRSLVNTLIGKTEGDPRELVPGMKFRWCPPTTVPFTMGSPASEKVRSSDEAQVQVTLSSGFWLGETEVTQGQWTTLMLSTPWKGKDYVTEGVAYPAAYISHGDAGNGQLEADSACEFCRRLTAQERAAGRLPGGWKYALPTEAQWEYACRAGRTTAYAFGDDPSRLGEFAWFDNNAWDIGEKFAHPVGKKTANAWGLRDMHGNVWEWCSDLYGEKLPGGRDPIGASIGTDRLNRGGSWNVGASYCRSARRPGNSPGLRHSSLGFRVAAVASSE